MPYKDPEVAKKYAREYARKQRKENPAKVRKAKREYLKKKRIGSGNPLPRDLGLLRKCRICGLEAKTKKDLGIFEHAKASHFGRANLCSKCSYEAYGRKWYNDNKDKVIFNNMLYQKNNPERRKQQPSRQPEYLNAQRRRNYVINPKKIKEANWQRRAREKGAEGSQTVEEFWEVCEKQKWLCGACGILLNKKTANQDHIVPLSKGGSDYIENIQLLCKSCNSRKRDKPFHEFMAGFITEGQLEMFPK
jgi:5-methylcytosine-specific restriction endonuclease McrA